MAAPTPNKPQPELNQKSLLTAYLCWLFGGLFGLHHFYLGRDKQAFIYSATFGGYFTMGLIRDIWRLPEYVREANNDPAYLDQLHHDIKSSPNRPPSSLARHCGLMMMGNLFAFLVKDAIPAEFMNPLAITLIRLALMPAAAALGVWLVGTVGRHQGSIKKPLVAAYLAETLSYLADIPPGSMSTLAATIVFNRYSKKWRLEKKPPKPVSRRILTLSTFFLLYLCLWTSWLYFGCTIDDPETEEPIKCRTALENFFKSSAYANFSEACTILIEHIRQRGFIGLWREIMQELDFSGANTALATLELDDNATSEQILSQYKKLSRLYHPDRQKDPSKKAEMQEKFIQVQEAYRKLGSKKQRYKQQRDRQSENDAEQQEASREEL